MVIYNWAKELLLDLGVSQTLAENLNVIINCSIAITLALLLDYLFNKFISKTSVVVAKKSKFRFNVYLIQNRTYLYLAHYIPLSFINYSLEVILVDRKLWLLFFDKIINVLFIIVTIYLIKSIIKSFGNYFETIPKYKDKPIQNQIFVINTILWTLGSIIIILIVFDTKFKDLFTTIGALSAITMLVFKDTILGFVASIQVTFNDTVRIGDWITSDKYGADGTLIEINLVTVKVQNFDNTITTIPTYSLISDSFKNWRGMTNSAGRRIKRSLFIKETTVRFLSEEEIDSFKEIELISSFINHRQKEITNYNTRNKVNKKLAINGRNLTNLGLFRKYMIQYLNNHTGINKDMTLMVRHLQPTDRGIPIEVYAFSNDKAWTNYESIMSDIFDHFIAAVSFFDLEIFELPSTLTTGEKGSDNSPISNID